MSDPIAVSLISTLGLIAVAMIGQMRQTSKLGSRLKGVAEKTELVREQVQNSHSTNLRDDQDRVATELHEKLDDLIVRVDGVAAAHTASAKHLGRKVDAVSRRLSAHIDANPSD